MQRTQTISLDFIAQLLEPFGVLQEGEYILGSVSNNHDREVTLTLNKYIEAERNPDA